jgi:hypothetical protein
MDRWGTAPPRAPALEPGREATTLSSAWSFLRRRTQQNIKVQIRATRATSPIVRPTAPPVPNPPPLELALCVIGELLCEESGGEVGVTVTVRT